MKRKVQKLEVEVATLREQLIAMQADRDRWRDVYFTAARERHGAEMAYRVLRRQVEVLETKFGDHAGMLCGGDRPDPNAVSVSVVARWACSEMSLLLARYPERADPAPIYSARDGVKPS